MNLKKLQKILVKKDLLQHLLKIKSIGQEQDPYTG